MKNLILKTSLVLNLILLLNFTVFAQESGTAKIATEDEIKSDIAKVKCKNSERLESVKELFREKGVKDEEIIVEDDDGVKNFIVVKKGKTDETIIVGAHYDEIGGGCGAIDNWTGIVIVANLYQTIKDFTTNKTYKFVAFDEEEKGLIGSRIMAKAIPKEDRAKYCSMVNFDSFGLTYPQATRNNSNKKLLELAEDMAKQMKMPFGKAAIANADSDSTSFQNVKIPAISFHGLNDKWQDYLHSHRDKVTNVNPTSVYFGYRFGLNFLAKLEAESCDAFRK
ncbi:MAG: M28 family metallopeptidase [Aridibacter sp.]